MTDSQIIDPQALDRLREWGGDKLAGQMVRLFLKNSGTRMDQIRGGVDGEDLEEAERGAHSLKSSAANIGAELLRTLATRLESAALDGDADGARDLLPGLETAYSDAMEELKKIEREMT
ncbi:MAG: Hpt domain-containing protein [Gemmatimonadota bacterium]|jgi:HPt (histidine-containing phosphotransfer) domain-containing protein